MKTPQGEIYRAKRNRLIGCGLMALASIFAAAILAGHVVAFWTGSAENFIGVVLAALCLIVAGYHAAPLVRAHIKGSI